MPYDAILEEQFKKFGITNPEDIKMNIEKYFTPDEKWEIIQDFFKQKEIKDGNVSVDGVNRMVIINFPSSDAAKKFADLPSEGLPAFARQWVKNKGEDFKKYDIYFNLGVNYEEKNPKLNKRVMVWCER